MSYVADTYTIVIPCMYHYTNDKEGPDDVQQLQSNQQTIEDVIGREHGHQVEGYIARVVDDTIRQHDQARQHPAQHENIECYVCGFLFLNVGQHFGALQTKTKYFNIDTLNTKFPTTYI